MKLANPLFCGKKIKNFFCCLAIMLGVFLVGDYCGKTVSAHELAAFEIQTNDPGFTLNDLNIDKQWALARIGIPKAWERSTGASTTIVAVIDTGIDEMHEDLVKSKFVEGYDFIKSQTIAVGADSDDNGHGTLVAGILAAVPNNSLGVSGANWQITLMPIKALDSDGRGDSSTVSKAMVWATDMGADIINLSLGGSGFEHDPDLARAVRYAFERGVVIVAAAGNDSSTTPKNLDEHPVFPVCADNDQNMIIGVSALDQNSVKPEFANFGRNCVDVMAPGKRILSTINIDPVTRRVTESGYAYVSGTSFSTAFVSAQAALIKSLYPSATNKQIRDRIIGTARQVDFLNLAACGGRSCQGLLGAGLIDVSKSLEQSFPLPELFDNDIVRAEGDPQVYWIIGGQKRKISPFVFNQRFMDSPIKLISSQQLSSVPEGPYATPQEGTLVKTINDPTVYVISDGLKLPVTGQIFAHRGFKFQDIKIVDFSEASSWSTGKFLAPKEGTLVKTSGSRTLYWTVGGVLHPVNSVFYKDRGLKVFPILNVTQKDLVSYNIGEAFIR